MILITGAAGKTGQAVIGALASRKATVRAFVYRDGQVETVRQLGAAEVVVGDMEDEATFRRATDGVEAVYHICPNMNPHEATIGSLAIEAAQATGVAHFVYHSVLHPQTEKMPHHWHKLRVEEMLFESSLDFTILQPAAYMQNVLAGWNAIVDDGVYRVPYPVDTRLGMVDLADVAEAAAIVLLEPGHQGAIYELTGPDLLTQTEVATTLSVRLGQPVRAEQIAIEVWRENARAAGLGDYQIETLVKMFHYYERYGLWGNSNLLRWLLERAPTRFEVFVERATATES